MRQHDLTRQRSQSFGYVAADYDRFRPGPPDSSLEWLIPDGARQVIEIGAGTGALTRLLLARGLQVQAVEPDARMRDLLVTRAPGALVTAGRGEEIPAPDGAADVVIASSSWHWVDQERGVPEVARVLRPGGRFALLWSSPDRTLPWLRTLWAGGVPLTDEQIASRDAHRRDRHVVDLGDSGAFSEPERKRIAWERTMSRAELLGVIGTYSAVITMDPDARQRFFASMERFLDEDPATAGRETFDIPMRCLCWRSNRLPASVTGTAPSAGEGAS
jgi:SAM-dependent methyltransferase